MIINKERIERVEAELGSLQDGVKCIELGLNDKLHRLEEKISKLANSISASKGTPSHNIYDQARSSQPNCGENEGSHQQFESRATKLECPRYSGNDPTEWYNKITEFFEYQEAIDEHKVFLASFHLEGEANQWWQWLQRAYHEKKRTVTWEIFVEKLWARFARFGPIECEDYDEALSRLSI